MVLAEKRPGESGVAVAQLSLAGGLQAHQALQSLSDDEQVTVSWCWKLSWARGTFSQTRHMVLSKGILGFGCLIQPVFYMFFFSPLPSHTRTPVPVPPLLPQRHFAVDCHPPRLLQPQVSLEKGGPAQVGLTARK